MTEMKQERFNYQAPSVLSDASKNTHPTVRSLWS